MTLSEAIKVMAKHNAWRRNGEMEMQNPADIGLAIEMLIEAAKKHLEDCIEEPAKVSW